MACSVSSLQMHRIISRVNSLILSVSLASHVSTHLLIHLSAHLYYHHHSHHPSLLHCFTPGSKPTFSTNPSHPRLLLPTGLPSWQRDWTGPIMLIVLFLVSHFYRPSEMRLLYFSTVGFYLFIFIFLSVAFPARPYIRLPQPVPISKDRRGGCYLKYDPFENSSHVGR